ncbi:hypothetical protein RSAG8_06735, partial [Rhizoctonia solani AG-8 WAC10335]
MVLIEVRGFKVAASICVLLWRVRVHRVQQFPECSKSNIRFSRSEHPHDALREYHQAHSKATG